MIRLVFGLIILGLVIYLAKLIYGFIKISRKEKELAHVLMEHEAQNIQEVIDEKRDELNKRIGVNDEDTGEDVETSEVNNENRV